MPITSPVVGASAGGGGGGGGTVYPRPIQAKVATSANVDVHGGPTTIQSVPVLADDIVLLAAQSDITECGLWIVVADDWVRHPAADSTQDIYDGVLVQVLSGTYADKLFMIGWGDAMPGNALDTDEIKALQVSGDALPQDLSAVAGPTFAGLTLAGFSGILKATAGVLSAAALALADLPTGSAGTVLTGTGGASAYSATPVLTAVKDSGANPATTGFVRASNATTIVAARNAANNANWPILGTDENGILIGSATGPTVTVQSATAVLFGAASPWVQISEVGVTLGGNDGTSLWGGDNAGNPFKLISVTDTALYIGQSLGNISADLGTGSVFSITSSASGFYFTPSAAATIEVHSDSTSVTYSQQNRTTNGATGALTSLVAQTCTGTTSTGGALYLGSGSGTSANGEIQFGTGGTTRLSLSAAGKILYFAAALTTAVSITQADLSTNGATGARLDLLAQSCTGTTSIGGEVRIGSGAGTTRDGYITFYRGTSQKGQIGNGSGGGTWFGSSSTVTGSAGFGAGSGHTISGIAGFASGASNSVSGNYATAFGGSCSSSADYTISGGYSCSASVFGAVALGNQTTASANGAMATGTLTTAANIASTAQGHYSYASTYAEVAHASGNASGFPQNSKIQISGTTSATATTNVNLKAGPSADQEIILRTGRIYSVNVIFVATGPSFSPVGQIELRNALVKDDSGTVTVIDAGTQTASATTPADWTISLANSGSANHYLRVNFAKTADATALRCSAKVLLVDVQKA